MMRGLALPDLEIPTCVPNCNSCPGLWINKSIHHKIVCLCCKSRHNREDKKSIAGEPNSRKADRQVDHSSFLKEATNKNDSRYFP